MQQAYQQQMSGNPTQESTEVDLSNLKITDDLNEENGDENEDDLDVEDEDHELAEEYYEDDDVSPASMWTKKELQEFKDSIRTEGGDSIIKVRALYRVRSAGFYK